MSQEEKWSHIMIPALHDRNFAENLNSCIKYSDTYDPMSSEKFIGNMRSIRAELDKIKGVSLHLPGTNDFNAAKRGISVAKSVSYQRSEEPHTPEESDMSVDTFDKNALDTALNALERINRSPPSNRYTKAHDELFSHSEPISSPTHKRNTNGLEESPTKRRRDLLGKSIGLTPQLPPSLERLKLDERQRLDNVSSERQRQRRNNILSSPTKLKPLSAARINSPNSADNSNTFFKSNQISPSQSRRMQPPTANNGGSSLRHKNTTDLFSAGKSVPRLFPSEQRTSLVKSSPGLKDAHQVEGSRSLKSRENKLTLKQGVSTAMATKKPATTSYLKTGTMMGSPMSTTNKNQSFETIRRTPTASAASHISNLDSAHANGFSSNITPGRRIIRPRTSTVLSSGNSSSASTNALNNNKKTVLPSYQSRTLSKSPNTNFHSDLPKSTSSQSIAGNDKEETADIPANYYDLPSYARPTLSALRKSKSYHPNNNRNLSSMSK